MERISRHELKRKFERELADQLIPDSDYAIGFWDGYKRAFKSMGVLQE